MVSKLFKMFVFLVVAMGATADAQTPAVLPSIRLDVRGDSQVATAGAYASASNMNYEWAEDQPPGAFDADTNIASASVGATAGVTGVLATGAALATGMCMNSVGVSDFTSAVDCTMNLTANANGAGYVSGEAQAWGSCYSQATYQVQANATPTGTITSGTLISELHLVVTGGESGYAGLYMWSVGASAAGSSVDAMGWGDSYYIWGTLTNTVGPPTQIGEYVPSGGGLNNFYTGSRSASAGNIFRVTSYIDAPYWYGVFARVNGGSLRGFSAHGEYAIY